MSTVEDTLARIYTINFSKAWLTPKHKRTDRVVNMIKEFATKHMKSSQIKIDQELNRYIWERGKTNPPRKVRVRIVKDEDESLLSWRSLPGATVMNAGKVEFRDFLGGQGTELKVMITFRPPAGQIGGGIAWLLSPLFKKMIQEDILNFKQYIETGYLPSIEE